MSKKIIADTSVIIKWLSAKDEKHLKQADQLLNDVQEEQVELYAPELSKYEVGNALLKGKGLAFADAKVSLATLYSLPIQFVPETRELAEQAYKLGQKHEITYYDATFLSLAQSIKATLVTDNVKHQGKTTTIKVVPLADYRPTRKT